MFSGHSAGGLHPIFSNPHESRSRETTRADTPAGRARVHPRIGGRSSRAADVPTRCARRGAEL